MIRKIRTSLTAKLFLSTTILLIAVCLISVFSMARYIPQTYSNRLSADLQKQANDLVLALENANSLDECYSLVRQFVIQTNATAYIEDENGNILYSTGLGLYIVRKIMELHHAKYGIKNSSSGVKFWFEIPQKRNVISSI